MFKNNNNLKALVLSMGLGAAMLAAPSVQAQGVFGDMLDNYYSEKESGSNSGSLLRGDYPINDNTGTGFSNGYFGESDPNPLPLGSGLAILIGAGLGYVALKKKEDKQ